MVVQSTPTPTPVAAVTPPHGQVTNSPIQADSAELEMNNAIEQVKKIVNQPVTKLPRQATMRVTEYKPGWFHQGTHKPDFDHVDVRSTQNTEFAKFEYVTSDLNHGVAFRGREVEFNPNTKYFYTDFTLPKKKLTEAEMIEINRLYRIIGECQRLMAH